MSPPDNKPLFRSRFMREFGLPPPGDESRSDDIVSILDKAEKAAMGSARILGVFPDKYLKSNPFIPDSFYDKSSINGPFRRRRLVGNLNMNGDTLPSRPTTPGPRHPSQIAATLKAQITKEFTELDEKFRQAAADISKRSQRQQIRQKQLEQRSNQICKDKLQTTLNAIGQINMTAQKRKQVAEAQKKAAAELAALLAEVKPVSKPTGRNYTVKSKL
ncbi:hypothetical protein HDK77DRAFT_497165 [Phyllosticta capitalensis]